MTACQLLLYLVVMDWWVVVGYLCVCFCARAGAWTCRRCAWLSGRVMEDMLIERSNPYISKSPSLHSQHKRDRWWAKKGSYWPQTSDMLTSTPVQMTILERLVIPLSDSAFAFTRYTKRTKAAAIVTLQNIHDSARTPKPLERVVKVLQKSCRYKKYLQAAHTKNETQGRFSWSTHLKLPYDWHR